MRTHLQGLLLLALLSCSAATLAAGAKVYRWVDANGNVHYGDQPPPAQAQELRQGAPTAMNAPAVTPQGEDSGVDCAQLASELERWTASSRLMQTDVLGQQRELSTEERAALIAQAQQRYDSACATASE